MVFHDHRLQSLNGLPLEGLSSEELSSQGLPSEEIFSSRGHAKL